MLVHTADAVKTRQFCLLRVGGVNTIGDATKLYMPLGDHVRLEYFSSVWASDDVVPTSKRVILMCYENPMHC